MDIRKYIADLEAEQALLEEALLVLRRLDAGKGKRRGRPPAWISKMKQVTGAPPKRRGRPPGVKNKPPINKPPIVETHDESKNVRKIG
jgi:hypothetical protein